RDAIRRPACVPGHHCQRSPGSLQQREPELLELSAGCVDAAAFVEQISLKGGENEGIRSYDPSALARLLAPSDVATLHRLHVRTRKTHVKRAVSRSLRAKVNARLVFAPELATDRRRSRRGDGARV